MGYLIIIGMFVSKPTVASTASLGKCGVVSFLLCESVATMNIFCTPSFLVIMICFVIFSAVKKTRNSSGKSKQDV